MLKLLQYCNYISIVMQIKLMLLLLLLLVLEVVPVSVPWGLISLLFLDTKK